MNTDNNFSYESSVEVESLAIPGVRYRIARISFARRLELTRLIWELARKVEFLSAGADPREKLEAAVLSTEIDRVYLRCGLLEIIGLSIDGEAATPEGLIALGPEALAREIAGAIKAECCLSPDERKN